jgi:hypothetical protein
VINEEAIPKPIAALFLESLDLKEFPFGFPGLYN